MRRRAARRYVNLDYAASTPVMAAVWDVVEAFVPWYSSVHRGTGAKSQRLDRGLRARARGRSRSFVGAPDGSVGLRPQHDRGRSTSSPPRCRRARRVLSTPVEHHANMLPWRRHDLRLLPFPTLGRRAARRSRRERCRTRRIDLLAVTGASNVTGEVWPLEELADARPRARRAAVRRRRPARAAPRDRHGPRSGSTTSRSRATSSTRRSARARSSATAPLDGEPLLQGGGAIKLVTLDDVIWADAPERYEAGSPNVIGAVALAAACESARRSGWTRRRPRAGARRAPARGPEDDRRPRPRSRSGPATRTASASRRFTLAGLTTTEALAAAR